MRDLQRHPPMKFIRERQGKSGSLLPPHKIITSLSQEMVGVEYGSLKIVSAEIARPGRKQDVYVLCRCACGAELWVYNWNLVAGKSTKCKSCASKEQHENRGHCILSGAASVRVQKRCNAMRQRCQNTNDKSYKNYGGRGIEFRFSTVAEAIAYVLTELPHPTYLGVDIDRKENDWHYEPGNLRLVTRSENLNNKRTTRYLEINGAQVPRNHVYHVLRTLHPEVRYTEVVVQNMVSKGLTLEEIVQRWEAPSCKPKGRTILPTPDQDIASLYLTA